MPVDEPLRSGRPSVDPVASRDEDIVDEESAANYSQRARNARKEQGLAPVLDDDDALDRVIELLDPHGIGKPVEATAEVPDKA